MTSKILVQRNIHLRYKPEEIGEKTIERVCRYYANGVMLSDIIQTINGPRACNNTINLADVFTILNIAAQAKKVKQRKKYSGFELSINGFVKVFRAWKAGMKPKEILTIVPGCKVGTDRVIRALNTRLREEKAKLEILAEESARDILANAHPTMVNGRPAFIVFYDEIPQGAINAGVSVPELTEDILFDVAIPIPTDEEVSSGKSVKKQYQGIDTELKHEDQHCSVSIEEDVETVSVQKNSGSFPQPIRRLPTTLDSYEDMNEMESEEEILDNPVYDVPEDEEKEVNQAFMPEEDRKSVKEQISDLLD